MSPLRAQDKLDALAKQIRELRVALVEREREAAELLDGEAAATRANERALATRLLLDASLAKYFDLAETERTKRCPVHGDAILIACPDCLKAHPHLRGIAERALAGAEVA